MVDISAPISDSVLEGTEDRLILRPLAMIIMGIGGSRGGGGEGGHGLTCEQGLPQAVRSQAHGMAEVTEGRPAPVLGQEHVVSCQAARGGRGTGESPRAGPPRTSREAIFWLTLQKRQLLLVIRLIRHGGREEGIMMVRLKAGSRQAFQEGRDRRGFTRLCGLPPPSGHQYVGAPSGLLCGHRLLRA